MLPFPALILILTSLGLSAAARTVSAGNDHSLQIPFYNSAQIAEATLSVSYDGQPVSNGSKMLPSATSKQPEVKYKGTETYTLMLIDPDVPSAAKPINRNFAHWLVTNIPEDKVAKGQTILEYKPPAPPPETGYHRYIFKLFSQGGNTIQVKPPDSRAKFSPEDFAKQYDLGDPLAILYFKAHYEAVKGTAVDEEPEPKPVVEI